MTPMLRELHEARKERLQRMQAWHRGNVVTMHKARSAAAPKMPPPAPAPEPESIERPPVEKIGNREVTRLADIASPAMSDGAQIEIRQIQQIVAARYRVEVAEIKSTRRNAFVMLPRHIAYALARRLTDKSLPTIGRAFGGRDHSTILHAIRKVEARASADTEFANELGHLERVITGKTQLPCPCCGSIASPPTGPDDNSGNGEADCS